MRLTIGNFVLPAWASFDLTQRYEEIGPEAISRTASGRGIKQMTWRKRRIVTQGSGWVPPGLNAVDVSQQHLVGCVMPVSIPVDFVTRQANLPAARRADTGHLPFGQAEIGRGQIVLTPVTVVGDVVTLADVAGATRYQVAYFPLLLCWVQRPTLSGPDGYGWELICEEV